MLYKTDRFCRFHCFFLPTRSALLSAINGLSTQTGKFASDVFTWHLAYTHKEVSSFFHTSFEAISIIIRTVCTNQVTGCCYTKENDISFSPLLGKHLSDVFFLWISKLEAFDTENFIKAYKYTNISFKGVYDRR